MDRPDIKLIKESLEFLSRRMLEGTIKHLIDYIEYLEIPPKIAENPSLIMHGRTREVSEDV